MTTTGNDYCVYCHRTPDGKEYIGRTKDVKLRWSNNGARYKGSTNFFNAIMQYGWDNIEHEILYDGLTFEEADRLEKEEINRRNTTDPEYGYNHFSTPGKTNKETVEKIRRANMGHPVSDRVRQILTESGAKGVFCVETGESFKSVKDASEKYNLCGTSISKAAQGKQSQCGGYHFRYLEDIENGVVREFVPHPIGTPIICVETNIMYANSCDAERKTGIGCRAIWYALHGVHETCNKQHWKYVTHEEYNEWVKEN